MQPDDKTTGVAEAFAELLRQARRPRPPAGYEKCRAMATDDLKRLWDSYDGAETADPEVSGEAVHLVLNQRGEGIYCAV